MELSVHAVVIENFGSLKQGCIGVNNVGAEFLLQQELYFKIPVPHCVFGFGLSGKWLARNMELVPWDFSKFWGLTDMKQHGLCSTN